MYKKINIFIINSSCNNLLQIFDTNNNKIKEVYVNNKYEFDAKLNCVYKIRIISGSNILKTSIYVSNMYNGPYIFSIQKENIFHKILIKFIDQNYCGLKIEKGVIKLWQNNIT